MNQRQRISFTLTFCLAMATSLGLLVSGVSHLGTSAKLDAANIVIDSLETVCKLQLDDIELWNKRVFEDAKKISKLNEDIRELEQRFDDLPLITIPGYPDCEALAEEIVELLEQIRQLEAMLQGSQPLIEVDEDGNIIRSNQPNDELLEPVEEPSCGRHNQSCTRT